MDRQRNKSRKKHVFNEASPQRFAEVQMSVSMVVLIHISIVVLTCCRIVVRKYFNKEINQQIPNETRNCGSKSINN